MSRENGPRPDPGSTAARRTHSPSGVRRGRPPPGGTPSVPPPARWRDPREAPAMFTADFDGDTVKYTVNVTTPLDEHAVADGGQMVLRLPKSKDKVREV